MKIPKIIIYLFIFYSGVIQAQMSDASFFPSVRSINPGVIHLSNQSFVTVNYGKEDSKKNHEVPLGGIVGGINTNINLKKIDGFAAFRGKWVNTEILYDKTTGNYMQAINSTTRGNRTISDTATSNYLGLNLDLYFLGLGYGSSDYQYKNEFRVDTVPNLIARDENKKLKYTNIKIGTAFPISILRFGFYYFKQSASGDYSYTFYDGTTGNKGSTEVSPVETSSKGMGTGLGFTLPRIRSEISYEKIFDNSQSVNSNYPGTTTTPSDSSRMTFIGEAKIFFITLGIRYRMIKGNYVDLNDIITSNLLYEKMKSSDSRNETSVNFSFGDSKGLSPSLFYTNSTVSTNEKSPVFDNGLTYPAKIKTTAYGLSLSYNF